MGNCDHVLRVADEDLAKDLTGKVYIVTGANSGVGLETTRQLVKQGAHAVMACCQTNAADEVAESFAKEGLKGTHESMRADLCDMASVHEFYNNFKKTHKRLNGLVCNASTASLIGPKRTTKDGFKTTTSVLYFGYFLMTELLLDLLKQSAPSKTLILSSCVHAGSDKDRPDVDLADLNWDKRKFDNMRLYMEAKVACNLYALKLSDRLKGAGVTTASVHPRWARSNFGSGKAWYFDCIFTLLGPTMHLSYDQFFGRICPNKPSCDVE